MGQGHGGPGQQAAVPEAAQPESRANLLEAASKAALEIRENLQKKGLDPKPETDLKPRQSQHAMGVVIHWSGIRGFGILRSQVHGEVFVHAKSLVNTKELAVGDVVTFEIGYDAKKQKAEAINCNKAGVAGYKAPPPPAPAGLMTEGAQPAATGAPVTRSEEQMDSGCGGGGGGGGGLTGGASSGCGAVDSSLLAGAAAAAALKLLSQGLGKSGASGEATAGGERGSSSSTSRSRSRNRRRR